jgi:cytochrome c553
VRTALLWVALAIAMPIAAAEEAELERGKRIVSGSCFLCHGIQGEAASELSPRLAGQNASYLAKQLANFKSGERKSGTMRPMAASLSTEDMRAVALYFSRQQAAPHVPADAQLAARGRAVYQTCAKCHGDRAHGSETLPRLAGQFPAYLAAQLKSFGGRERTNDDAVMHAVAARMTADEIDAVAAYLGSLD